MEQSIIRLPTRKAELVESLDKAIQLVEEHLVVVPGQSNYQKTGSPNLLIILLFYPSLHCLSNIYISFYTWGKFCAHQN